MNRLIKTHNLILRLMEEVNLCRVEYDNNKNINAPLSAFFL